MTPRTREQKIAFILRIMAQYEGIIEKPSYFDDWSDADVDEEYNYMSFLEEYEKG